MIKPMFSMVVIMLILITTASCVPVLTSPSTPNEPPIAYIDSISATTITEGQTITFSGHGTDIGGSVVAYSWRSDQDGVLSTAAGFSMSSLSVGTHYVYFKVQDNRGDWSRELYRIITVRQAGTAKPSVNSFKVTPDNVIQGASATLTWDVSDATTVSILPDIGDVPLVGSRLISPTVTTIYTLTAKNTAGTVTENAKVTIAATSNKVVELFSIIGEEGSVNSNGVVDAEPKVGVNASAAVQAFFSFDISMIPPESTITSASIDFTNYIMHGQPIGMLGALGVFDDQYGVLKSSSYVVGFTHDALVYTYSQPIQPYTSQQLAGTIQMQVAAKNSRFQVRVQFEKFAYQQPGDFWSNANYLEFIKGKNKLAVSYK